MSQRIVIGNEVYRQSSGFDPSQIRTTEDEYGTLYVISGIVLTGDITEDVANMASDPQLDEWLYGEFNTDASLTDEAGSVVYGGSDVLDAYKSLGLAPDPEGYDPAYESRYGATEEESFAYNVDDLDMLVATALRDEAVEGGDMFVTVDIRPVAEIRDDLGSIEDTLNNASLITTVAGEYLVEAEGTDVLVAFNANSRDVDRLVPAFLDEE